MELYHQGEAYYYGRGVVQDYYKAFACFLKGAQEGMSGCINWVGWCYQNGIGVKVDYKQAEIWFIKSSEKGNERARFHVARMYYQGMGIPKDEKKALKFMKSAADTGINQLLLICFFMVLDAPKMKKKHTNYFWKNPQQRIQ